MRTLACLVMALTLAGCGDYSSGGSSDGAAIAVMGATAFMNGYNQARPQPMLTCFNTGMMTMCQ